MNFNKLMYKMIGVTPIPVMNYLFYPIMIPKIAPEMEIVRQGLKVGQGIKLMDGTYVSPDKVFRFLFTLGLRYPRAVLDFRHDYHLISGFKLRYLQMSYLDRLNKAKRKGVPIIGRFFPQELIFAAGGIPVDIAIWFNETVWTGDWSSVEKGHQMATFETCHGESGYVALVEKGTIPLDLFAPACSFVYGDTPCCSLLIRSAERKVPLVFTDFPHGGMGKEWATEYLVKQFKEIVQRVSALSGKKVKDDDLWYWINAINQVRRKLREVDEICMSAPISPIANLEHLLTDFAAIDYIGDPIALADIVSELCQELKERVKKGIKGEGIPDNPIRLFVAGIVTAEPIFNIVEDMGGVFLGYEVFNTLYSYDVEKNGDPYQSLAKWCLEKWPYSPSIPFEQRVDWLIDFLRRAKIEGVIFNANWGCNWQPPLSHLIADIIDERLGIPTLILGTDMPERGEKGEYHVRGQTRTRLEAFMEMLKSRREMYESAK